jgi:SET domain-containing protein
VQPFDYLLTGIKSYIAPSKIHGVGLFALVDIKRGEQVFPIWKGETGWYKIKFSKAKKLPTEVLSYILRSFGSKIENDDSDINFVLIKDTNFLFSNPLSLINTKYNEGNTDSKTGKALKDIKKGEEITGNYSGGYSQLIEQNKLI